MPAFTVGASEFVAEAGFVEGAIGAYSHGPDLGAFNLVIFLFLVGGADLDGLDHMIGFVEFDRLFVVNNFIGARRPGYVVRRGFCGMATI